MAGMKYTAKQKARVLKRYGARPRRVASRAITTRAITRFPRPEAGLPDLTVTKLRYCDTYKLTSLVGAVTSQSMRMNSIFDPDATGAGHQPLYHDTWAGLYNRYCVTFSSLKVVFSNDDVTAGADWIVGVISDNNTGTSATITTNQETSNCVWKVLTPSGGSRDQTTVLATFYTPKKSLGLPITDDTVGSAFGASPSAQWFGNIWAANLLGSASSSINATVTMDYYVRLNQVLPQTGS